MCGLLFEQGFPVKLGQLVRKLTKWNMLVRDRSNPSLQPSISPNGDDETTLPADAPVIVGADVTSNPLDVSEYLAPEYEKSGTETRSTPQPGFEYTGPAPASQPIGDLYPSTTKVRTASNLAGTEAQTRILQKMEAAKLGFPEIDCCCDDFFKAEKSFKRLEPLYQMLLDATEPGQSLHYVRALARLCRSSVLSEAMTSKVETTLQYYTDLLDRPHIKNDAAYAIALQLASIQDGMKDPDEKEGLRVTIEFFDEADDAFQSTSKTLRDKYSHLYHRLRNLSILDLKPSEDPSDWIDTREEQRRRMDAKLLQRDYTGEICNTIHDCREVVLDLHNLVDISEYASTLKPWSYHEGHIHARTQFEDTNTIKLAQRISAALASNVQRIRWSYGRPCSISLLSLMFDAVGLIVAQEFQARGRLSGLPNDDIPTRLAAATGVLNISDRGQAHSRNTISDINWKVLQTMWICDPNALFTPQGLHIGPCRAKKCWDLLSGNVKQFDRTTALIAPTALPRNLEPQVPDDVSMLSTSTKSSFQKFRRFSDKLRRQNSTVTVKSVFSKWSGHMSIDSLTPERVLGSRSDILGPILPAEEHRRLDEEAFMSMQSIRV